MPKEICRVIISSTSKQEANSISDYLLRKKLIAGSLIIKGPSKYWWKGEIVEKEYHNIQSFSVMKNKPAIIDGVKKYHKDECPIVAFYPIDGNTEFLEWVREYTE